MPTRFETALGSDAADSAATAFSLDVGGWAHGTIANGTDGDFVAVSLVAGQTYSVAMVGIGGTPLPDPLLQLFASDGVTQLAMNANGLANGNAGFGFTATTSGTYYLRATGETGTTGDYAVAASVGDKPSFDAAMIAGVLNSHASWSPTMGTAANLTFGFSDTITHSLSGFSQFTQAQKDATCAVLAMFAEVAGLTFTEVSPGGYTDAATLLYGNFADLAGDAALAGLPDSGAPNGMAGDVWINTALLPGATAPTSAPQPGSLYFQMLLHEIGHSLGLSHPSTYALGVGETLNFADHADFAQDSTQFTVMSYFDAGHTGGSALFADTLGIYDILALQQIYGANTSTRSGDTTYGFGSNAGLVYDFDCNIDPMLTLWDSGGIDTLNTSYYSADQVIRLGEGALSDVGGYSGNVGIAIGTVIENAIGGRGSDQILGNGANNHLQGRAGDDLLEGGSGDDTLQGGEGGDTLRGGTGNDSLSGDDTAYGVAAPQVFGLATTNGPANSLTATGVELFLQPSFTLELVWQQLSPPTTGVFLQFGNLGIQLQADFQSSLHFADAAEEPWLTNIIPATLLDGEPHRLSISYDDTCGKLSVYVDGVRVGEHDFTSGTRYASATGDITLSGHAGIGDLRIFDGALSAQEIWDRSYAALPQPSATPGLLNYWTGNGASGLQSAFAGKPSFVAAGNTGAMSVILQDQTVGNLMEGGLGDDHYDVRSTLDMVVEAASSGSDTITAHVDFTLGTGQHVERLLVALGSGGVTLTGNERTNEMFSALDAADVLAGGAGDDLYHLYHAQDQVIEAAGGGNDVVYAHANFILSANSAVETLVAAGDQGVTLIGNNLANRLIGNAAFADTLAGAAGNDTYLVYRSSDQVIEAVGDGIDVIYAHTNYVLASASSVETLYAAGAAGRSLTGNGFANIFHSSAAYADTLAGGAGNDIYYTRNANDRVIEASGAGTDVLYALTHHTLYAGSAVEQIWAQGSTGIALTGNSLNNTFYSNLAYADTLTGGAGNDVFHVRHASDRVIEASGGGNDVIYAYANHTLYSGSVVEELRSVGTKGLSLTGNALANVFHSNAAYADTLTGGAGNDVYHIRRSSDLVKEASGGGTDTVFAYSNFTLAAGSAVETLRAAGSLGLKLTGNSFSNSLYGSSKADTLDGGTGQDVLYGGLGTDALKGGTDRVTDRFVFKTTAESLVGSRRDTVSAFVKGIDDIDISAIDANTQQAGNQSFAFGTKPLANGLWVTASGPNLLVRVDVNGDKIADMEILILGATSVAQTDFIL